MERKGIYNRPLTIVQMLPNLEEGGVECETVEMAIHLSRIGHRPIVISGGGRMTAQLEGAGCRHIRWSFIGEKSPRCLAYLIPLRRLLTQEKVDILHLRSRLPAWIGYLAWKSMPKTRRPRLLTTFHGFYSINAYSAIMTKGERVIAVSRTIADHIREAYQVPADRIDLVYGGFDETQFDPKRVGADRIAAIRRQWRLENVTAPVILLPGRFTRLKGHDFFIRSLARIRHLPWIAVCAGDVPENSDLMQALRERIHASNLTERIIFPGHCGDMPAAMRVADIVVSASIEPESFGRVAIEALAMGTPVVATAHGGSLETIRHQETGWLVPPNDEAGMAVALAEAVTDKARAMKFGRQGQDRVRRDFTTQKLFRDTMAIYYQMAGLEPNLTMEKEKQI